MSEEVQFEVQNTKQTGEVLTSDLQNQQKSLNKKDISQKLKIEELDQDNNVLEYSEQLSASRKCPKHPEEDFQFYCFNKEHLLCSECLVSGKYVGLEIANMRKAAEKLKGRFSKFISEALEKYELYQNLEEEIQSQEEHIKGAVSTYEEEILKLFNQVRQRINEKEQELINNLQVVKQERIAEFRSAAACIQNYRQEIEAMKNSIEGELKNIDELNLCKYYQEKNDVMKDLLDQGMNTECVKEIIENQQLQDQMGLSKLQDDFKMIWIQLDNIGGIEINKVKPQNKESTKLGRMTSFFSSLESDSSVLKDSRETLLFRPSTPSRSTIALKPTYLSEDLVKATSMPNPQNNIFEKHLAKVHEIRRQTPKQDARIDSNVFSAEIKKVDARGSLRMEMKRNTISKKYSGLSLNDSASLLDICKDSRHKNTESKTPKTFMLSSNISPSNKGFGTELSSPNNYKTNSFLTSVTTKAADKPEKIGFDSSIRYMKLDRSLYELQNAELQRKNSAKVLTRENDGSGGLNVEKMFAKRKAQERTSTSNLSDIGMKKKLNNLSTTLFK